MRIAQTKLSLPQHNLSEDVTSSQYQSTMCEISHAIRWPKPPAPVAVVTGNAVRPLQATLWVSTGEEGIVSRQLQDLETPPPSFGRQARSNSAYKEEETFHSQLADQ